MKGNPNINERAKAHYRAGKLSMQIDKAGRAVSDRLTERDPQHEIPAPSPDKIAAYTIQQLEACGMGNKELYDAINKYAQELMAQTED